ncbi:zinc binding enoyl reductase [Apiospora kogelbergensis]|uniref:zinc binding enoyl reductase n=1 Tax=Apiospora kogelbergensis TaxID=1337665 RepID=UPI0031318001
MIEIPLRQTAILAQDDGTLCVSHNAPVPSLEDDMILVKNAAIALNPIDTKMVGKLASPGAIAGMDYAGEVIAIGSKVQTAAEIHVGDRVCGAVQGMHSLNPAVGAFAEIVGATDVVTIKVPNYMTSEEAASLGSGVGTIGLALFKSLDVPGYPSRPAQKPVKVLVYGGSTATGTLAIQLLELSGLAPIATCSPRNFELVKSYGAEAVFDYHQTSCPDEIRAYTKNSLKYVLDCISEPETMQFCYKCIGRLGGKYTALEPFPQFLHNRPTVQPDWVLGPTLLGKRIGWGAPFEREGDPEVREFAVRWYETAQKLLDDGKLRTHPLQQMPDRLNGVLDGMEILRKKQVSGKKLIYSLG